MHVQKSTAFNYIIHSYKVINAMEFMIINDDLFDLSADNRTHTFPLVINRKGGLVLVVLVVLAVKRVKTPHPDRLLIISREANLWL